MELIRFKKYILIHLLNFVQRSYIKVGEII